MRIILVFLLLSFPALSLAEVYKWTDADGRVHFTDQPVEDAETVELKVRKLTPEQEAENAAKHREFEEQLRLRKEQNNDTSSGSYSNPYRRSDQNSCRYHKEKLSYARSRKQNLDLQGYSAGQKKAAEDRIRAVQARVKQYCR